MGRPVYLAAPAGLLLGAVLAGILLLGLPPAAAAFGPLGHRVVGAVAEEHLCTGARDQVRSLLEEGESLGEAGLWADRIRGDGAWDHTGPWHYINVPDDGSPARVARVSPHNVLAALARQEQALLDRRRSREQRATALRFVVHLVADIHQPLHVGRAADRGGNTIQVLLQGKRTDLHAFWDAQGLLQEAGRPGEGFRSREHARSLRGLVLAQGLLPGQGPGPHPWQASEPADWARESLALRPLVYDYKGAPGRPVTLSRAYVAGARNTVNLRLAQAGVRLAGRLNRLGCDAAPTKR